MYTDIFLGDAPEAAQPWISSHIAARTTTFTLTDGTTVNADLSGNIDNKTIAQYVHNLNNLKEVIVGSIVDTLNNPAGDLSTGTFARCNALEKVVIQRETKKIDTASFAFCTNLSSVVLPNSITDIGIDVFRDCSNLKEVEMPCNIDKVSEGTFGNCTSLEKITFNKKINYFAAYSLANLPSLKKLVFKHKTVDEVKAINGFSNLSSVGPQNFDIEAVDGTFKFYEESSSASPAVPGIGDIVGPGGTNG